MLLRSTNIFLLGKATAGALSFLSLDPTQWSFIPPGYK